MPNILNNKPIKLISREYFVSLLRDYEFHLENICPSTLNVTAQHTEILIIILDFTPDISKQPTLHDHVHYSLRIKSSCKYLSHEIYYSIDSH